MQSLDGEDPLEKDVATPVFLSGESHGQRSLVGYSPWGRRRVWTELSDLINIYSLTFLLFMLAVTV